MARKSPTAARLRERERQKRLIDWARSIGIDVGTLRPIRFGQRTIRRKQARLRAEWSQPAPQDYAALGGADLSDGLKAVLADFLHDAWERTHPPGPSSPCPGCGRADKITEFYVSPAFFQCSACGACWDSKSPGIRMLTRAESYAKRPELYAGMSPDELQRWLDTGEVPDGKR